MNNKNIYSIPTIIKGGVARDDRGGVSFVNDFNFLNVRRFYVVENSRVGMIRAWHGHKREAKYVFIVSGSALVGAVKIDNWKLPSKETKVYSFTLSSKKPEILYIPEGYANGFKSLSADAKLIFFSTSTLEESKGDDIRFDEKYWDIWG